MGVVLHVTWRHKGFNDGREIEVGFGAALKLCSRYGLLPCLQEGNIRELSSLDMYRLLARFRAKRMVRLQIVRRR